MDDRHLKRFSQSFVNPEIFCVTGDNTIATGARSANRLKRIFKVITIQVDSPLNIIASKG